MKVATAAYPLHPMKRWSDYTSKIEQWVRDAEGQGADLLVFPEYGAMELATLAGADVAADGEACMRAVSDMMPEVDALHADLAGKFGVTICAGSAPAYDDTIGPRPVNRVRLFTPEGGMAVQDKQIMTRYERDEMDVVPGGPLQVFNTGLAKIAVLTCYDAEFPLLGRAVTEAEIILVPSCTEVLSGYWRVRIGAMARALEQQCVTVMASLVSTFDACPHADANTGMGGVFGPPDKGFPETGVQAEGTMNTPGWTFAEVNLQAIADVRADGRVLGRTHWAEQYGRDTHAPVAGLR
ncbi:MAG: carbon-nitrogen hydrolase family protein [Pseudomonadota bacterium]